MSPERGLSPRTVRFGPFEADLSAGELRKNGIRVRVQEQPFQVLAALLDRPGEVVSREELIQRLWPDGVVVDYDRGLNAAVTRLRQALADSAEAPRYVETVARRGYRFIGVVAAPNEHDHQPASDPPRVVIRRHWRLPALIAVVLAVAVLVMVRLLSPEAPRGRDRVLDVLPLTAERGFERNPTFSPDGSQVAFEWDRDGGASHIYVKVVGSGDPVRLTAAPAPEYGPAWSRDGRHIAFLRAADDATMAVFVTPAVGGVERKAGEIPAQYWPVRNHLRWLDWFPDNRHLVVSAPDAPEGPPGLIVLDTETGQKSRLTQPSSPEIGDREPAVSPDGRTIAFTRGLLTADEVLHILPLSADRKPAGEPREVASAGRARSPAWTPDGRHLVFASVAGLSAVRLSPAQAVPLEWAGLGAAVAAPALSRTGQLAFSRTTVDTNIWRQEIPVDPGIATEPPVRLIASTARDQNGQYSPDGKRIAIQSTRSGYSEIHVCDSNGAHCVQITRIARPYITGTPRWSPNGQWLAFDSAWEGRFNIYVVSADGGSPRRLTRNIANSAIPSWSRDGKWIYFASPETGRSEIWKVPFTGGGAVRVTRNGGMTVFESPDGKELFYNKSDEDRTVWRCALDGTGETAVLTGVTQRAFVVTSDRIYYVREEKEGGITIRGFLLATAKDWTIARIAKKMYLGLSLAPGGRYLIYSQVDDEGADLQLAPDFGARMVR